MAKRIDPATLPVTTGTKYPPPYDVPCHKRQRTRLGDPAGLTQLGGNLLRLPPGAWPSQRDWHANEDEFVWVLLRPPVSVYSAAAGCASAHSDGSSSSLRSGKNNAQPSVTTEKTARTVVTAATLLVRS